MCVQLNVTTTSLLSQFTSDSLFSSLCGSVAHCDVFVKELHSEIVSLLSYITSSVATGHVCLSVCLSGVTIREFVTCLSVCLSVRSQYQRVRDMSVCLSVCQESLSESS